MILDALVYFTLGFGITAALRAGFTAGWLAELWLRRRFS